MAQPQSTIDMRLGCQCGHVFNTPRSNVSCPGCGKKGRLQPWPTAGQLEAAGLVRCEHEDGCSIYVDPENMPSRRCIAHTREQRRDRNGGRGHGGPRIPYIPRDGRTPAREAKPTRRDRMAAREGGQHR